MPELAGPEPARVLFVYGDKPTAGGRTSELTVRAMIGEARDVAADPAFAGCAPFRVGVTSGLRPVPGWKSAADFVFAQVSFSVDALLRWRDSTGLQVPVYAGVMVLASVGMARRLASTIPDIDIPASLVDAVERDRGAGVDDACEQVLAIRDSRVRRRSPGAGQPVPRRRRTAGTQPLNNGRRSPSPLPPQRTGPAWRATRRLFRTCRSPHGCRWLAQLTTWRATSRKGVPRPPRVPPPAPAVRRGVLFPIGT